MARHVFALQVCTLFVNLRFRTHHDSGNTESALQTTTCCERVGIFRTLSLVDSFEGDDVSSLGLADWVLARHLCLAVDHDGAATTLTSWRAPILGRGDIELVAQCCEKMWMILCHRDIASIDPKSDAGISGCDVSHYLATYTICQPVTPTDYGFRLAWRHPIG